MDDIILDFTDCKYYNDVHQALKEQLKFPEHYGKNLDALWDCLFEYCPRNSTIYIKGLDTLPSDLREYMNEILEVFDDFSKKYLTVTFKIQS